MIHAMTNASKTLPGFTENTFVTFDNLICFCRKYTCETLTSLPAPLQPRHTERHPERFTADMVVLGGLTSMDDPYCNWMKLDTPM